MLASNYTWVFYLFLFIFISYANRKASLNSSELNFAFLADRLTGRIRAISTFKNKLLFGQSDVAQLFIYSNNGRYISNITLNDTDGLSYATWTPSGKIIYSTEYSAKVVVMSEQGKTFVSSQMTNPRFISVANNNIIYLADLITGVHQSSDEGATWSLVFSPTEVNLTWIIRVISENYDDFWTLKEDRLDLTNIDMLGLYSAGNLTVRNVTRRKLRLTSTSGQYFDDLDQNFLSYDGGKHIFLMNPNMYEVHVFLVSGQYYCKLLFLPIDFRYYNRLLLLTIDQYKRLLYVVFENKQVKVFKLIYNNKNV